MNVVNVVIIKGLSKPEDLPRGSMTYTLLFWINTVRTNQDDVDERNAQVMRIREANASDKRYNFVTDWGQIQGAQCTR